MRNQFLIIFGLFAMLGSVISCNPVTFATKETSTDDPCSDNKCVVTPQQTFSWLEGTWSMCNKPCGGGLQTRSISCIDISGAPVPDNNCTVPKPNGVMDCNLFACTTLPHWNVSDWSNCNKACGGGQQTRNVLCQDAQGTTVPDGSCSEAKPAVFQVCNTQVCPAGYFWQIGDWGACTVSCGGGTQTRSVVCAQLSGAPGTDADCASQGQKPITNRECHTQSCDFTYTWVVGDWGTCSKACDTGLSQRSIQCKRDDGVFVDLNFCPGNKPAEFQNCNTQVCPANTVTVTDTFTVPVGATQLDVLLVVDDSGSMSADNNKLASRLQGFVNELQAQNIDWRMCMTTTDIHYYAGALIIWSGIGSNILTRNAPNISQSITDTITAVNGGGQDAFRNDERGIYAMNLAVQKDAKRPTPCFRPSAAQTVILISDEDERSVAGQSSRSSAQYKPLEPLDYPNSFIDTIHVTYGNGKKFTVNSIIVNDSKCEAEQDAQGSPSFQGTLYRELAMTTGGHVGSICDSDYSNNLRYAKEKIVNSMEYRDLTCTPVGSPIIESVVPTVAGLQFSVEGTRLRFSPLIPEGTTVKYNYKCLK